MTDVRSKLRALLVDRRADLRARLAPRLGGPDQADEALQDVYLKLQGDAPLKPPGDPFAYLIRMAVNAARDGDRSRRRRLGQGEIADILETAAAADPDPENVAVARSELGALRGAMAELTDRQRRIVVASRLDETPHKEIARQLQVSTRTVELELKKALEHCATRLQRKIVRRFGPKDGGSSLQ